MKIGIKIKLAIVLSTILLATTLTLGAVMIVNQRNALEFQMRSMASTITDEFANDSKMPLLQKDSLAMNLLVQSILTYPGIKDAYILNENLVIEAHKEVHDIGTEYRDKAGILAPDGEGTRLLDEDDLAITFVSPIVFKQTSVGYTVISFSKDFISEQIFSTVTSVILITAVAVVIVSLLSIPLASGLLRPIFRLFKGTKEIAAGNFDYRIPVKGKDEIGELVRSFNSMASELKKKEILKGAFDRYVSTQVADEILKDPDHISLGGERRDITVFFADIRDFTAHTARMTPEEVVEILNRYFTIITEIIFRHKGMVDKFIGDAVMGVFGSPVKDPEHLENAVKAAFAVKSAMSKVNGLRESQGQTPFHIGIGLDTGSAVVGNMGSSVRMEYTAVGESVNMASRLAGIAAGGELLVSEYVYAMIKEYTVAMEKPETLIKGIERPVGVYNIEDLKGRWKQEVEINVMDAIAKIVSEGIAL